MLKTSENIDIDRSGEPDEKAKRGYMVASAMDAAMKAATKAYDTRVDSEKEEKKEETRKMDADAGEKIDKILACLDSIMKDSAKLQGRLDAIEEEGKATKLPKDGAEAAMDKKKADGLIETHRGGEPSGIKERGDPKELAADRKDTAYADSVECRDELGQIHAEAAKASNAWGQDANHPWTRELPDQYRRRAAAPHQQHSKLWKDIDLTELSGKSLQNVVAHIFQDSHAMAGSNEPWAGGDLREVRRRNDSGHLVKEYYGSPSAWMSQFSGTRRLARFNLNAGKK
jgi:hypothetical protein